MIPVVPDIFEKPTALGRSGDAFCFRSQRVKGYQSRAVEILNVMYRISKVVRPIHNLCFGAASNRSCRMSNGMLKSFRLTLISAPFVLLLAGVAPLSGSCCIRPRVLEDGT